MHVPASPFFLSAVHVGAVKQCIPPAIPVVRDIIAGGRNVKQRSLLICRFYRIPTGGCSLIARENEGSVLHFRKDAVKFTP